VQDHERQKLCMLCDMFDLYREGVMLHQTEIQQRIPMDEKGFVSPFPSSSRIFSIMSYNSSTSSFSCSDVGMYTCINKILIGTAYNLIAMILSL